MSVTRPENLDEAISPVSIAAAAANIIMQLSLPGVGRGVVESTVDSGKVFLHPIKRARTTFTFLAVSLWGSDAERAIYREAVNTSHRRVRSTTASPVRYNAFDPDLQLWVAACLYRGLEDVHRAMYPEAGFRGGNGIYQACHHLGTTLQVREGMWPEDRDAFEDWWKEHLAEASIDPEVRRYLEELADLRFLPAAVRLPLGGLHRFFTIGFLPPELRCEMGFRWSADDQERFDSILRAAGRINRRLPQVVRKSVVHLYLTDFRLRVVLGRKLV